MLSHTAGIEEVLWNFSQFKDERRITLHDNPHFYSDLPTSFDAYTAQFKALPIANFAPKPNATIYVLVDQPRRVFLETKHDKRTFGNAFVLNDVMIFKGMSEVFFSLCCVSRLFRYSWSTRGRVSSRRVYLGHPELVA